MCTPMIQWMHLKDRRKENIMPKIIHYDAPVYSMPEEDLLKYYKQIARTADDRLRALEKYTKEENFKVADKWAYSVAMRDIHKWSGENANRFNTAPPPNIRDLQKKVIEIEEFLNSPTSTKLGIRKVYGNRSKTYKKQYGINLSWSEVGDFFLSNFFKSSIERGYGSKTIMISVGYMQKYGDAIKEELNNAISNTIHVSEKDSKKLINQSLKELDFTKEQRDILMEYLKPGKDTDRTSAMILAAEVLDVNMPGVRQEKGDKGFTKQDIRNIRNMARNRSIRWEEIM